MMTNCLQIKREKGKGKRRSCFELEGEERFG